MSKFDFSAAIKQGQEALKNKNVGLILLGPSGSGKSRACGTFGVKTLYLHTSGESHGPASAAAGGSEILPICIDKDGDKQLSADEAYTRLLEILGSTQELKKLGIGAVAIDGATELENIIQNTTAWKARLAAEYKGVKSYAGDLTLSMFRPIILGLQKLQTDLNIHYVITCILSVKEYGESNEILDASPSLYGFNVATGLIQQFPDILVVGQVSDGERTRPAIQLGSHVSKATKDQKSQEVRKLSNFYNRITGADLATCPDLMKPSLKLVAEIKKLGHYPEV
jgi:hypothetical protein